MATKYSDIIRLRGSKPAYNIEEEKNDDWESFIPNEQFNGVLKTVINAVRGNNIDMHKSFWVNGTYGTGKSHACAVLAHLLSEPAEQISEWINQEYSAPKYAELRQAIYKLRETKRLLPIKIIGLCNMQSVSDLALVFQKKITAELSRRKISLDIPTDFEIIADNIKSNPNIWQTIIDEHPILRSVAPTSDKLAQLLSTQDISVYQKVLKVQRETGLNTTLQLSNLNNWIIDVQNALAEKTEFNGLLILWDEFTDVVNSFGVMALKEMQTVAEKLMDKDNNTFLCLISHPSAFNNISNEEQKQTDGRYHRMKYNMEPVSAFKIMSSKFLVADDNTYQSLRNQFVANNRNLYERYITSAPDPASTREDLYNLFPLHPGTANLATHYATSIGSSSRSVFEFLGLNPAISDFLESEQAFNKRLTITADYLWDYVLNVFQDDATHYAAVTERYNSYRLRVEKQGPAYSAIFKGVLLLNAFNNISGENNHGLVVPSKQNIKDLFEGTQYSDKVEIVLDYFNDEGIIQRAPGEDELYSVQFSALPSQEIETKKCELRAGDFRYTYKVVEYGDAASNAVNTRLCRKFIRPYKFHFYSDEGNESVVASHIKTAKREARPSDMFLAMLVARNNIELAKLKDFAEHKSQDSQIDKDLANVFFVVFDETLNDKDYERFIEFQANYACASTHGFSEQMVAHRKHSSDLVSDYMLRVQRGNATIYVNGKIFPISVKHFSSSFNDEIALSVYSKAPESIDLLRAKSPQTFWANKNSKDIVRRMLSADTKEAIWENNGQIAPMRYFLQDALDDKLQWLPTVEESHPLKAICTFIDNKIKYADKSNTFNFVEKFDELTKPPYGLYSNFTSMAAVAFALRPWVNKVFDTYGKPRDAINLAEDIAALFKAWETGKNNAKLNFKFQTPEEGQLCKSLTAIFGFKSQTTSLGDITSLKDARFAITGTFIEKKGYPLWSLKYASKETVAFIPGGISISEDIIKLIDNIVRISTERELRDPRLVNETLKLIADNKVDIKNLLQDDEIFKNGFHNFLKAVDKVNLQDEEIDEAIVYIKQHIESTIGYWTEEEVRTKLKDWKLEQTQSIQPVPIIDQTTPTIPSPVVESTEIERKRQQAKSRINALSTIEQAKNILLKICDYVNNIQILDQINSL